MMGANKFNAGRRKYIDKSIKDDHVPCWSARDFSESKGLNYKTLLYWLKESDLKPVLTTGRTKHYSIRDLNEWYESKWINIDTK